MRQTKHVSKRKHRKEAVAVLGAVGISVSLAGAASATTAVPSRPTTPSGEITLREEEVADVSLATFYVYDREAVPRRGPVVIDIAYRSGEASRRRRAMYEHAPHPRRTLKRHTPTTLRFQRLQVRLPVGDPWARAACRPDLAGHRRTSASQRKRNMLTALAFTASCSE